MTIGPNKIWLALLIAASFSGCGGGSGDLTRFVPETDTARSALETALDAWQAGEIYGPITSSTPEINIVDSRWQAGAKLESFEILADGADEEGHRQFDVKMQLVGQAEESVTYLVIGIDPLHIFRSQDYQKATGM